MTAMHTRHLTRAPILRHLWALTDHRTASSCPRPRLRTRLQRLLGPTGVERCPSARLGIGLQHRVQMILPEAGLQSSEASRLLTRRRSRVRPPVTTLPLRGGGSRHRGVHLRDRLGWARQIPHLHRGAVRPLPGVRRPRVLLGGVVGRHVAASGALRTRHQPAAAPGVRPPDLGILAESGGADGIAEIGIDATRSGIGQVRPTAVRSREGATIRRPDAPSTGKTFGRHNQTILTAHAVAAARDDERFRYVAVTWVKRLTSTP